MLNLPLRSLARWRRIRVRGSACPQVFVEANRVKGSFQASEVPLVLCRYPIQRSTMCWNPSLSETSSSRLNGWKEARLFGAFEIKRSGEATTSVIRFRHALDFIRTFDQQQDRKPLHFLETPPTRETFLMTPKVHILHSTIQE